MIVEFYDAVKSAFENAGWMVMVGPPFEPETLPGTVSKALIVRLPQTVGDFTSRPNGVWATVRLVCVVWVTASSFTDVLSALDEVSSVCQGLIASRKATRFSMTRVRELENQLGMAFMLTIEYEGWM